MTKVHQINKQSYYIELNNISITDRISKQRQKQINYGYNTKGYQNYIKKVFNYILYKY